MNVESGKNKIIGKHLYLNPLLNKWLILMFKKEKLNLKLYFDKKI